MKLVFCGPDLGGMPSPTIWGHRDKDQPEMLFPSLMHFTLPAQASGCKDKPSFSEL